jgi:arylsulfatase A-like enzyme
LARNHSRSKIRGFYSTDAYAERAADWLDRQQVRESKKPFFLYLPFYAAHNPLQAPRKYLDRFGSIVNIKRRTLAAMLSAVDDAVGKVLGKLEENII